MLNLAHTGYLNQAGICMSQPPSRGPGFTQRLKPPSIFEKKKVSLLLALAHVRRAQQYVTVYTSRSR